MLPQARKEAEELRALMTTRQSEHERAIAALQQRLADLRDELQAMADGRAAVDAHLRSLQQLRTEEAAEAQTKLAACVSALRTARSAGQNGGYFFSAAPSEQSGAHDHLFLEDLNVLALALPGRGSNGSRSPSRSPPRSPLRSPSGRWSPMSSVSRGAGSTSHGGVQGQGAMPQRPSAPNRSPSGSRTSSAEGGADADATNGVGGDDGSAVDGEHDPAVQSAAPISEPSATEGGKPSCSSKNARVGVPPAKPGGVGLRLDELTKQEASPSAEPAALVVVPPGAPTTNGSNALPSSAKRSSRQSNHRKSSSAGGRKALAPTGGSYARGGGAPASAMSKALGGPLTPKATGKSPPSR